MNDRASQKRRPRPRVWPCVMAVPILLLACAWIARAPILRECAELWVVSDPLQPADAIAVLGGGITLRPFVAARLYKQGLAPKVLVSNVRPDPLVRLGLVAPHPDETRPLLVKLGVPEAAIVGFGRDVASTFDEARALAAWAEDNRAHTIIVPTEIFPSRRQRWILDHELKPVGARVILDAVTPPEYGIDDWWRHDEGLIGFQNEVIKYVYYRVKYRNY
jgi:uncharacterized SAM-binding protein YcdF (DUF218 family)